MKVLLPFTDKYTWKDYVKGSQFEGTPERVNHLAGLGLVEAPPKPEKTVIVEKPPVAEKPKAVTPPKKKK